MRWAARNYSLQAHRITLSENQYQHNRRLIREEGLEASVTVEPVDYRELPGESVSDKILSVGMFEHVGIKNLPLYFRTARRVTKRHSRNPSRAARDGSGQGRPFGKTGRPRVGSPIVNRSQA